MVGDDAMDHVPKMGDPSKSVGAHEIKIECAGGGASLYLEIGDTERIVQADAAICPRSLSVQQPSKLKKTSHPNVAAYRTAE